MAVRAALLWRLQIFPHKYRGHSLFFSALYIISGKSGAMLVWGSWSNWCNVMGRRLTEDRNVSIKKKDGNKKGKWEDFECSLSLYFFEFLCAVRLKDFGLYFLSFLDPVLYVFVCKCGCLRKEEAIISLFNQIHFLLPLDSLRSKDI
uniref:Uncharacterized protein n=1 Tax=Vitis vinifera TaxID=29760 RepID=F6HKR4_VITVI